jgi:solute carrier family 25 S-adenosylmethionine transporter 26
MSEPPFTLALVAGACAGTSVDVSLHPLDTLRTRLQSEAGFIKSGGVRGIYKGILSAALGSAPGAAIFFSTYEMIKQVTKASSGNEEHWTQHFFAASCAELAACVVRVPTANVTQNMQVGRYASLTQAVRETYGRFGLGGFYVGYGTTVMREVPFGFIQFPLYEAFRREWAQHQGKEITPLQGAACGSFAGCIAAAITTPLDVASTRIMLDVPAPGQVSRYTGTLKALQIIHAEEGARALFKGIGPLCGWTTIGGFIFFGAYEGVCSFARKHSAFP